jgi:hypothetical protein
MNSEPHGTFTPLKRVLSYGKMDDPQPKAFEQTAHLSGDERVSMLEELKYEMAAITGDDYSQRLRRILSYSKRA